MATALGRMAMHAMTFGNARAVAILWQRFVREVRFAHWEACQPLPRMQLDQPRCALHIDFAAQ